MARNAADWSHEREEMRRERDEQKLRLEIYEARTKRGDHEVHDDRGREKWRKLEIPIFSGDDAFGWTHRLERYFQLKELNEEERMQVVVVAMEGRALSWYQWWWERCNSAATWESFKIAVVRRFQPSMIQNPFEILLSLKQERSVDEYVRDFEKYVGALRTLDPEFVRGIFLNGLKEDINAEVKKHEHLDLSEVIQQSLLIEKKSLVPENSVIRSMEENRIHEVEFEEENLRRKNHMLGDGDVETEKEEESDVFRVQYSKNFQKSDLLGNDGDFVEATVGNANCEYKLFDEMFVRDIKWVLETLRAHENLVLLCQIQQADDEYIQVEILGSNSKAQYQVKKIVKITQGIFFKQWDPGISNLRTSYFF